MNLFKTTYYVGVGENFFGIIGGEIWFETIGIGFKIKILNWSVSLSINLIGSTSLTFSVDKDVGNGMTTTQGFTIGINTGALVLAIAWICKVITTGDTSSFPVPAPAF